MAKGKENTSKSYTAPFSLRLRPETKAVLEQIAEQEDRSVNYIINRILNDYVDKNKPK